MSIRLLRRSDTSVITVWRCCGSRTNTTWRKKCVISQGLKRYTLVRGLNGPADQYRDYPPAQSGHAEPVFDAFDGEFTQWKPDQQPDQWCGEDGKSGWIGHIRLCTKIKAQER